MTSQLYVVKHTGNKLVKTAMNFRFYRRTNNDIGYAYDSLLFFCDVFCCFNNRDMRSHCVMLAYHGCMMIYLMKYFYCHNSVKKLNLEREVGIN